MILLKIIITFFCAGYIPKCFEPAYETNQHNHDFYRSAAAADAKTPIQ
jgi:hypothetical protein